MNSLELIWLLTIFEVSKSGEMPYAECENVKDFGRCLAYDGDQKPHDCISGRTCKAMVIVNITDNYNFNSGLTIDVYLTGGEAGKTVLVGAGFGPEVVGVACLLKSDGTVEQALVSKTEANGYQKQTNVKGFQFPPNSSTFESGTLFCRFQADQTIVDPSGAQIELPDDKPELHLFDGDHQADQNDLNVPRDQSTKPVLDFYANCNQIMFNASFCWGLKDETNAMCDQMLDCPLVFIIWIEPATRYTVDILHIKMKTTLLKTEQTYISVGFSLDDLMGSDSVVTFNLDENKQLTVSDAINEGKEHTRSASVSRMTTQSTKNGQHRAQSNRPLHPQALHELFPIKRAVYFLAATGEGSEKHVKYWTTSHTVVFPQFKDTELTNFCNGMDKCLGLRGNTPIMSCLEAPNCPVALTINQTETEVNIGLRSLLGPKMWTSLTLASVKGDKKFQVRCKLEEDQVVAEAFYSKGENEVKSSTLVSGGNWTNLSKLEHISTCGINLNNTFKIKAEEEAVNMSFTDEYNLLLSVGMSADTEVKYEVSFEKVLKPVKEPSGPEKSFTVVIISVSVVVLLGLLVLLVFGLVIWRVTKKRRSKSKETSLSLKQGKGSKSLIESRLALPPADKSSEKSIKTKESLSDDGGKKKEKTKGSKSPKKGNKRDKKEGSLSLKGRSVMDSKEAIEKSKSTMSIKRSPSKTPSNSSQIGSSTGSKSSMSIKRSLSKRPSSNSSQIGSSTGSKSKMSDKRSPLKTPSKSSQSGSPAKSKSTMSSKGLPSSKPSKSSQSGSPQKSRK